MSKISFKRSNSIEKFSLNLTCDPTIKKATVNAFLKNILCDIREINLVKNDIGFLLQELFPMQNSFNLSLPFNQGTIFYCWVCLKKQIFTFDLIYIRMNLSDKDIKKIIDKIKLTKTTIYSRRLNEKIELPFNIQGAGLQF